MGDGDIAEEGRERQRGGQEIPEIGMAGKGFGNRRLGLGHVLQLGVHSLQFGLVQGFQHPRRHIDEA